MVVALASSSCLFTCDWGPGPLSLDAVGDGSGGAVFAWQYYSVSHIQTLDSQGEQLYPGEGKTIRDIQRIHYMISHGSDGVTLVWQDYPNSPGDHRESDVYAQRINREGDVLWAEHGVLVSAAPGYQGDPQIISDGSDGAIIIWYNVSDQSTNQITIRAQHYDSAGMPLWPENGVTLCTDYAGRYYSCISDDSGGAIVAWTDWRNDTPGIYAQRIDSTGHPVWQPNGVPVTGNTSTDLPRIVSDGLDGVIIAWQCCPSDLAGYADVYGQRVSAAGELLWADDGVLLCPDKRGQWDIAGDGQGNAFVVWDGREGEVKKIDSAGNTLWHTDLGRGEELYKRFIITVIDDGAQGAFVLWRETVGSGATYVQRFDASGQALWPEEGVRAFTSSFWDIPSHVFSDGQGGIIIGAKMPGESHVGENLIYAQRIDSAGNQLWSDDGIQVFP